MSSSQSSESSELSQSSEESIERSLNQEAKDLLDYTEDNEKMEQQKLQNVIERTAQELSEKYTDALPQTVLPDRFERAVNIMNKIENIMLEVTQSFVEGRAPKLVIRNTRLWSNCVFSDRLTMLPADECTTTEIKFSEKRSTQKYSLTIFILSKIYKLLATREVCTKRELYYQNCLYLKSQEYLDNILNNITCLLECPLHDLNINATSKGLIYGKLKLILPTGEIDFEKFGGVQVPTSVTDIIQIKCEAKYALVVEKDAIFQKLLHDEAYLKLRDCLFVTAKGFPDINTRLLLKKLWDTQKIPIFALVDPDPYGIDIMCIYRFGSLKMSHQSDQLAIPSMRWLGIFPSEIDKFYDNKETLKDEDRAKIKDLLQRPYIKAEPLIEKEIKILLDNNYKAEIEGIQLTEAFPKVYLYHKLLSADFI